MNLKKRKKNLLKKGISRLQSPNPHFCVVCVDLDASVNESSFSYPGQAPCVCGPVSKIYLQAAGIAAPC